VQIPETDPPTRDLIALITTAHTKKIQVEGLDGRPELQDEIDSEGIFWQTQNVNSQYLGLFVKEYKDLESLQHDAYNHMSAPRAKVFAAQLGRNLLSYRYSIEAKASETVRDKNNNQPNLIDKIKENRVERKYVFDKEAKKTFLDGLLGRDAEKDN
jgi:hypothetical protein